MDSLLSRMRKAWPRRSRLTNHFSGFTADWTRPSKELYFETGGTTAEVLDTVCRLFSAGRDAAVYEYLRQNAASPLQIPFYYLELVRGNRLGNSIVSNTLTAEQMRLGYQSILQRSPGYKDILRRLLLMRSSPDLVIKTLLSSREAIMRMPRLFTSAFPHARRLWHLHIPKTAGTTFFTAAVESGWGFVNINTLSDSLGSVHRLAGAIRLRPEDDGDVIISGHWHLFDYLDCIPREDRILVFVRDPLELMVSEFNYAVDVVNRRSNVHAGEAAPFFERGLDPMSFRRTYDRGFFSFNLQCSYLSKRGTFRSALDNLNRCHAELIPSEYVNRAILRHFPHVAERRDNVSNKYVHTGDIDRTTREKILVRCHHDVLLYQSAKWRLQDNDLG